MTATVHYRVSPLRRHEHLFAVEARFPDSPASLRLWMPVWTPGSYLVREYARHVQELRATDADGTPLTVERLDKASWRVGNPAGGEVRVRYLVYANELTVRTNHLDADHGFFTGAALFLTSDAHRPLPCRLELEVPEGWRAFCALRQGEGGLEAADFDELVDSPVEMGPHRVLEFQVAGVPHQVVLSGEGEVDGERLTCDLAAICQQAAAVFGGALPFERYLFIVHLTDKGRGGLEHRASTTLQHPRFGLRSGKAYEDFLALAAHEYFHLWNVKRIAPAAFVPFDYLAEGYTRQLWAFEGITSYYDTLLVRRAARIDARGFLRRLGETITTLESTPGRQALSVAESSLLAWIKLYRADENTPNTAISYYTKGEVVAALLDLRIRAATGGQRSLDDAMRLLFGRHGQGAGVPEGGVEQACVEVGGASLAAFFADAVHGTTELDYSPLRSAGLTLRRRPRRGSADKGGTAGDESECAWLGVELKAGERAVVATTFAGTTASGHGLYAGDEIVALDGFRVNGASLTERVAGRRPGERVRLSLFRGDRLLELELPVAACPPNACWIEKLPQADAQQKSLYQAWLGEPFDAP